MNDSENNPKSKRPVALKFWLSWVVFLGIFLLVLYGLTPRFSNRGGAKPKVAIAEIRAFGMALDMFKSDNGYYPAGTNGLNDLVVKPAGATTNWHQYLGQIPLDFWSHPYLYTYPGKHGTNAYDLSSAGPDGKFGTADDISNWQQPK
jgi:general secretion pathway protein G